MTRKRQTHLNRLLLTLQQTHHLLSETALEKQSQERQRRCATLEVGEKSVLSQRGNEKRQCRLEGLEEQVEGILLDRNAEYEPGMSRET